MGSARWYRWHLETACVAEQTQSFGTLLTVHLMNTVTNRNEEHEKIGASESTNQH